jgi:hypothetical protein
MTLPPLPAVPTDLPFYVASTRGNFTLNISAATFTAAEESCRARGGHLAYFSSQAEQAEVRPAWLELAFGAGNPPSIAPLAPPQKRNSRRRALLQVEQWYVQQGYLLPTFHQGYWIGLVSNSTNWPQFRWSDNSVPILGGSHDRLGRMPSDNNHGARSMARAHGARA